MNKSAIQAQDDNKMKKDYCSAWTFCAILLFWLNVISTETKFVRSMNSLSFWQLQSFFNNGCNDWSQIIFHIHSLGH